MDAFDGADWWTTVRMVLLFCPGLAILAVMFLIALGCAAAVAVRFSLRLLSAKRPKKRSIK